MKNELLQDLENRFETLKHIRNLAQSYDEKLFCYLLEQSTYKTEFKNRFFIVRNNTYIFKLNDFLTFLDLRNLSGSFTSYTNKIGLGFKTKSFLKTNNEVVLNFAYKDGVIKGGQSKDEDKKNEIFFNEILAKDEIDVLFAPKALQNFELIGQGDLKENLNNANLLIKGNNLLALHSLKKKFANKVKLIYIDPPYNTGNDSFNYNDNFNHSTWLTFMKNRLEIAREFLRDDGVIFIQCDDNEQAYLKVLCDEIFGRDNFVGCCPVVVNRGGRDYGGIAKTHDYLLIYGKTLLTELYQIEDKDKKFQFSDENGGFNLMELRNRNIRFNKENRPNLYYPFYVNPNNTDENELLEISLESKDGFIELYPLESQGINTVWRWGKEKAEKFLNTEIKGKRKQDGGFMIVQKNRLLLKRQRSIWDNREFVNERGTEHIKQMLGRDSFSYPKSEFLLQRILELTTQENDLVMDFFAGSGTTLAVAHKMKRRFIGIEQMDYIESITKERLKKVINGEQGGISKALNWQGGGSFIYAELMPLNVTYKERIKNINDEKELEKLYNDLESKAFLDYRIDLAEILKDKEFKDLDLQNKQEALLKILDSNMDYVLYGDIEDKDYAISSEVIELNKIFYGDDNV
ncbi:site-specific DNA-methyltransferase [Campylobacter upsaliensis]|uniref:site-specific DNA-methyltransferase n=1 Tax=Campylobacter upsaliensis TaxID=28080 RepID=UPI0012F012DD|nr:site-specific DNA-methyltransferase [Campylobacter upsaliensis]ECV9712305.1 site-specific DNA-methyltransferase [Campylobacter upsaliensis]MBT0755100.1 site-specific DNA-methyltransferase [Campylobacter upsaliensis]